MAVHISDEPRAPNMLQNVQDSTSRFLLALVKVIAVIGTGGASGCASDGRAAARYLQSHPAELQLALDNLVF